MQNRLKQNELPMQSLLESIGRLDVTSLDKLISSTAGLENTFFCRDNPGLHFYPISMLKSITTEAKIQPHHLFLPPEIAKVVESIIQSMYLIENLEKRELAIKKLAEKSARQQYLLNHPVAQKELMKGLEEQTSSVALEVKNDESIFSPEQVAKLANQRREAFIDKLFNNYKEKDGFEAEFNQLVAQESDKLNQANPDEETQEKIAKEIRNTPPLSGDDLIPSIISMIVKVHANGQAGDVNSIANVLGKLSHIFNENLHLTCLNLGLDSQSLVSVTNLTAAYKVFRQALVMKHDQSRIYVDAMQKTLEAIANKKDELQTAIHELAIRTEQEIRQFSGNKKSSPYWALTTKKATLETAEETIENAIKLSRQFSQKKESESPMELFHMYHEVRVIHEKMIEILSDKELGIVVPEEKKEEEKSNEDNSLLSNLRAIKFPEIPENPKVPEVPEVPEVPVVSHQVVITQDEKGSSGDHRDLLSSSSQAVEPSSPVSAGSGLELDKFVNAPEVEVKPSDDSATPGFIMVDAFLAAHKKSISNIYKAIADEVSSVIKKEKLEFSTFIDIDEVKADGGAASAKKMLNVAKVVQAYQLANEKIIKRADAFDDIVLTRDEEFIYKLANNNKLIKLFLDKCIIHQKLVADLLVLKHRITLLSAVPYSASEIIKGINAELAQYIKDYNKHKEFLYREETAIQMFLHEYTVEEERLTKEIDGYLGKAAVSEVEKTRQSLITPLKPDEMPTAAVVSGFGYAPDTRQIAELKRKNTSFSEAVTKLRYLTSVHRELTQKQETVRAEKRLANAGTYARNHIKEVESLRNNTGVMKCLRILATAALAVGVVVGLASAGVVSYYAARQIQRLWTSKSERLGEKTLDVSKHVRDKKRP